MARFEFLVGLLVRAAAIAVALFLIGFVLFANSIERGPGAAPDPADGIVVLTGGRARISEAVKLLAAGKAQRLLISGVHRRTTRDELSRQAPDAAHLFRCCIDLDRRAQNTIDNATETRSWVKRKAFASLIVVTSSYHMPRTLVEFERTMPGVALTPYSVTPGSVKIEVWWAYPGTLRLLFSEYVKYISAVARLAASRVVGGSETSDAARAVVTSG